MKKLLIYILLICIIFETSLERIGFPLISTIDEVLVIVLFIYTLVVNKFRVYKSSIPILLLTIVYFITGVISYFINSYDPNFIIYAYLGGFLTLKFFLLIFTFMNLRIKNSTYNLFLNCGLRIAKFTSIFVVFSFLFPSFYANIFPFVVYETPRLGFNGAMGLFYFPGLSGWFYSFVTFYYMSKYHYDGKREHFNLFVYFFVIASLSLKVKVILSLVIITALWILIFYNKNKIINFLLGFIGAAGIFSTFSTIIQKNISYYILGTTNDMGESARYALMDRSFQIARDYFPLGVGFSKYGSWFSRVNYSEYFYKYNLNNIYGIRLVDNAIYVTDTYWPQVLGETGLLGIATVIVFFGILFFKISFRLLKSYNSTVIKMPILFAFFILIHSLLESSASAIFNTSPQLILIAFVIGYSISINIKEVKEKKDDDSFSGFYYNSGV